MQRMESDIPANAPSVASPMLLFTLPALMTIETVEQLAGELKQLPLADKTSLLLDASSVESITTPGLQLIVSLDRTLAAQGGSLLIQGHPPVFTRAFQDAGLESILRASS